VRVFLYLENREGRLDSAVDTMMLNILAGAAELEREKAAQRTTDAMLRKARRGEVTGGRLFGYDNVPGPDGKVTRVINEGQAAIVRRIYEWYADGLGFKRIAAELNAERVSGSRGTVWQHTAIRELLHNPTFGGVVLYNRTKRTVRGGKTNVKIPRGTSELVTVPKPELQIVPDDVLARVRAKLDANGAAFARGAGGRLIGKPAQRDLESKHLLVGFMKCARCGAHMIASPRSGKKGGKVYHYYRCSAASNSGKTVCAAPSVRSDRIEPHILTALQFALGDEKLNEVFDAVRAEEQARQRRTTTDFDTRRAAIQAELTKAATSRRNLLRTIEQATEDVPAFLLGRAKEIEIEEKRLRAELDALTRAGQESAEEALAKVRGKVESLRKLLSAPVAQARGALRRLGVQVNLTLEPMEGEPGLTSALYSLTGTFADLAGGILGGLTLGGTPVPSPTPGGVLPRWCREGESNPHALAGTRF
jgi:site-specific DNA recombinase